VVALGRTEPVRPEITRYLNRLSDWLFVLARLANHRAGAAETTWEGRKS
jgi:cob(I)alamin adenosyltransferase